VWANQERTARARGGRKRLLLASRASQLNGSDTYFAALNGWGLGRICGVKGRKCDNSPESPGASEPSREQVHASLRHLFHLDLALHVGSVCHVHQLLVLSAGHPTPARCVFTSAMVAVVALQMVVTVPNYVGYATPQFLLDDVGLQSGESGKLHEQSNTGCRTQTCEPSEHGGLAA
jgi:hypothetical protein